MKKTNIITAIIAIIAIVFAVVGTLVVCNRQKQEAFEEGYQKAIEDAILVSSNDKGYILNFEGGLYNYTF